MLRIIYLLVVVTAAGCASISEDTSSEVYKFMDMLTRINPPSLLEYSQFSGDGDPGELELGFELRICRSRGWAQDSPECLGYIRQRWQKPDVEPALFLSWFREHFDTVNKSYEIKSVKRNSNGILFDEVDVYIGADRFVLVNARGAVSPGGMTVGIASINGKPLEEYLPQ